MRHSDAMGLPSSRRAFGFWICLALVVGNMIGSGVFALPSELARYGWNAALGWLVTIAGSLCLAFVFARLARGFPEAGGPYAYCREAFGPGPGFAVAWSYWISILCANAAIALTAISYLSHFVPALAAAPSLPALAFLWALTALSCLNVRGAGKVQVATTLLKLLPLFAAIILICLILARSGTAAVAAAGPPVPIGLGAISSTAALTLWAMVGFESATIPAEHVRDPASVIPRATMAGTLLTGLIYLIACTGVALLLPRAMAIRSNAPFADFIGLHWGAGAASLGALFAAIGALGALNGWVLLQGELPLALAKDGAFPRWLAKVSPSGAPVRAQLVSSAIVSLLVLANQSPRMVSLILFMALVSTTATLVAYLACSLAALWLQRSGRLKGSPILVAACLLGFAYSAWAVYGVGWKPAAWGLALMAVGLPVYLTMRWRPEGETAPASVEDEPQ
ncbi:MAG: amino acid permease [Alphaproteobacteria bacterium]|nr:amino acid permease [Alphaproteobacteria bacterium]